MKLIITVKQPGHKTRVITTEFMDNPPMSLVRSLWEVEKILNDVPGSDLRFHIDVTSKP